jgi:hypothetical protein
MQFEFVQQTASRLQLAYSNALQGHVGIVSVFAFRGSLSTQQQSAVAVTGQRRKPGCAGNVELDADLGAQFALSWAPEVVPLGQVPSAFEDCYVRWVSGDTDQPTGNLFYLSSTGDGQYQTRATPLRVWPMQDRSFCFVDLFAVPGPMAVPPLCGALQLRPFQSNLGNFPTGTFLDFLPSCAYWAAAPVTTTDDEGYVTLFLDKDGWNSPASPCSRWQAAVASSEFAEVFANAGSLLAVVVPENLSLQVQTVTGPSVRLNLGPGTYGTDAFRLLEPQWPLPPARPGLAMYCTTVNPRSIFIAKMCSGFAGAKSSRYVPQKDECNQFMRGKCTSEQLFNSSVCGCYQDQADIQSRGLPQNITAAMVNRPQCFGTVCALGSAYREREWLDPCGEICQQVIVAVGSDYAQNVNQVMSCGGELWNLADQNEPVQTTPSATPAWLLGLFAALGALAVIFAVLFAVFYSRRSAKEETQ